MQFERICGECNARNVGPGRFCRQCGKPLDAVETTAGCAVHSHPLPCPAGMEAVERAADLYFRTESAFGGPTLIGTETMDIVLFNSGFALKNTVVHITGHSACGAAVLDVEKWVENLPRGVETRVEVPSYEIHEPVAQARVVLISAEYA